MENVGHAPYPPRFNSLPGRDEPELPDQHPYGQGAAFQCPVPLEATCWSITRDSSVHFACSVLDGFDLRPSGVLGIALTFPLIGASFDGIQPPPDLFLPFAPIMPAIATVGDGRMPVEIIDDYYPLLPGAPTIVRGEPPPRYQETTAGSLVYRFYDHVRLSGPAGSGARNDVRAGALSASLFLKSQIGGDSGRVNAPGAAWWTGRPEIPAERASGGTVVLGLMLTRLGQIHLFFSAPGATGVVRPSQGTIDLIIEARDARGGLLAAIRLNGHVKGVGPDLGNSTVFPRGFGAGHRAHWTIPLRRFLIERGIAPEDVRRVDLVGAVGVRRYVPAILVNSNVAHRELVANVGSGFDDDEPDRLRPLLWLAPDGLLRDVPPDVFDVPIPIQFRRPEDGGWTTTQSESHFHRGSIWGRG